MKKIISVLLLIMFIPSISASYAGDKPPVTIIHDTHRGGVEFSLGNSTYSGEMDQNDTYTVGFNIDIPDNGKIKTARAYSYWVWSKKGLEGIYPLMDVSISHGGTTTQVSRSEMYTDTKGFVGRYDFFSGVDVYDLDDQIHGDGIYSISMKNSADDGRTFCLQGIGLLIIYESEGSPVVEYWINEGCDMLYADYGITPEMATTTMYFKGKVDTGSVNNASLITICPSGGYSQNAKGTRNKLFFNEKTSTIPVIGDIIKVLFGSGKMWKNAYITSDSVQIAQDERDVTNYLQHVDNFVSIQDCGDYMLSTNAVLILEKGNNEQAPNSTSGFGLLSGIVLLLIVFVGLRSKR